MLYHLCFIIHFFLFVKGIELPQWMIEDERLEYSRYEECIRKREVNLNSSQNSKHFYPVSTPVGALVTLECFECLDPSEAKAIEDVWKPNESLLSRKVFETFDKFKEAVKHFKTNKKTKKTLQKRSTYYWEFLAFGKTNSTWQPVLDMYEPLQLAFKVAKMMKNFFFGENQRFSIGNHFELEIMKSNVSDIGWYRCVESLETKKKYISRAYFLDVIPDYKTKMMKYDSKKALIEQRSELAEFGVELYDQTTMWTRCNKCGSNQIGERRMQIFCYIQPFNSNFRWNFTNSKIFSALQFFGKLPCFSALIPQVFRQQYLQEFPVYEVFEKCQIKCLPTKNETRIVKGFDESGTPFVLDRLPAGEFTLNERLPPIKERVRRKILMSKIGTDLILDCGVNHLSRLGNIVWKKNYVELNSSFILNEKEDRIVISAHNRLIILTLKRKDTGIYMCAIMENSEPEILAIFIVNVVDQENLITIEISLAQIILRFVTVVLLVLLFVSEMRRAKTNLKISNS